LVHSSSRGISSSFANLAKVSLKSQVYNQVHNKYSILNPTRLIYVGTTGSRGGGGGGGLNRAQTQIGGQ